MFRIYLRTLGVAAMKKFIALIFALLMFSTTAFAATEESKLHGENNEGTYGCSVTVETCEFSYMGKIALYGTFI